MLLASDVWKKKEGEKKRVVARLRERGAQEPEIQFLVRMSNAEPTYF